LSKKSSGYPRSLYVPDIQTDAGKSTGWAEKSAVQVKTMNMPKAKTGKKESLSC